MPIKGDSVTLLHRKWHVDCFACQRCRRPVAATQFAAEAGRPYHLSCHPAIAALEAQPLASPDSPLLLPARSSAHVAEHLLVPELCHGCGQLIREEVTTAAMGQVWHRDCFRCRKCARPIRENKFRTDGRWPLHINCKLADSVRICIACFRPIAGVDVTEAMGELWHPECFRCAVCSLRIFGTEFVRKDLRPAHVHCKRAAEDRLSLFLPSPARQVGSPPPGGRAVESEALPGVWANPACGDCGLLIADDEESLLGCRRYHKRCIDALTPALGLSLPKAASP
eukprot:EG_transcript_11484